MDASDETRTHRERKEMYIKALEQEVLRLKEVFSGTTRERDTALEENRRLKELLSAHGISYDFSNSPIKFQRANSSYGLSSSGSISGSYPTDSDRTSFSPPPPMPGQPHGQISPNGLQQGALPQSQPARNMAQLPNNRLDYDQIGIDFVLTLERPCMDHMQYLLVRSHNNENQPFHHPMEAPDDSEHEHMSGHALMATAPPQSHIMEKPSEKYPHQMPFDMNTEGLSKLLDLSNRLPFDHYSEITPVMAWTIIYQHGRVGEFTKQDFDSMKQELGTKVRCYGFGAVLEEFEVRDAIENVLEAKNQHVTTIPQALPTQQISAY